MALGRKGLRFLWWNVQLFAHYDERRRSHEEWPMTPEEAVAKRDRIAAVLRQLFGDDPPELLGFAEATRQAMFGLRDRGFPGYEVVSLDLLPAKPEFHVAMLYRGEGGQFQEQGPLVLDRAPRGTRAMAVLDYLLPGHCIRIIACHWTPRFSQRSEGVRADLAWYLNGEVYEFLQGATDGDRRHVLILGDLNEEPYGLLENRLYASRDRAPSRRKEHYADRDQRRVRLYNCAWRYLGERYPHRGGSVAGDTAGTYYWAKEGTWHTFDHVIATGSLLTPSPPFLDETSVRVATCPLLLESGGRPLKFAWNNGNPDGVSDHLPVVGRVVLNEEDEHA
jgi:hypothetical protein